MTRNDQQANEDGRGAATPRVAFRGQIDLARRDEMRDRLAPFRAGLTDVIVDLSDVTFMDSSGLSALATLAVDLEPHGRRVTCVGAQRPVERLIRLAGIDRVVEMR
jgi:anti-sigma B factor antagonist